MPGDPAPLVLLHVLASQQTVLGIVRVREVVVVHHFCFVGCWIDSQITEDAFSGINHKRGFTFSFPIAEVQRAVEARLRAADCPGIRSDLGR